MDVLFPKIGEIIGGSEREADYTKLLQRMKESVSYTHLNRTTGEQQRTTEIRPSR